MLREAEGPGEAEDPQEGLGLGREERARPVAVEAEGEPREAPRGRARAPVAEEPGEEGEPGDGAQGLERLRPGTGLCAEEGLRGEEQEPRGGQAGGREEEPALDPATPADGEQRRERQEQPGAEPVGEEGHEVHADYRAPCPERITCTVWNRIARSRNML